MPCECYGKGGRLAEAGGGGLTWLGGWRRRILRRHGGSLASHGARGDAALASALAVGSLPATGGALFFPVLVLPAVTLLFVFDVPGGGAESQTTLVTYCRIMVRLILLP